MCSIPTKHLLSRLSFRRTKTRDLTPIPASADFHDVLNYTPFTHDDEIRLIVLHAGGFDESIHCELVHVRLEEKPAYDALSYVWGKEQDTDDVVVNGCRHRVGRNLFLALKHLRLEKGERRIWIDALCINQQDDNERGHQVAQMGVIYSHAAIVRIWLGLSNELTEATFSTISQIHYSKQDAIHFNDDTRNHFIALCSRPYWDRLWIIQEVVLASKLEVHCGSFNISWDAFSTVTYENSEALDEIRHSGATSICRQKLAIRRKSQVLETSISLLNLMEIHIHAQCADVRDKIYGLHSFAPECCRRAIPVEYSCSAYKLCGRLLIHEMLQHTTIPKSFIETAHRLRCLLVDGATNQHGSHVAFDKGTWEASVSNIAHSAVTTCIAVRDYGKVVWTSPPLSQVWSDGKDFDVPLDLISFVGSEDFLPARDIIGRGIRSDTISLSPARKKRMDLEDSLVQVVPLPRDNRPAGNTASFEFAMDALRNILLSAQAQLSTKEECYLALVKTDDDDPSFIYSKVRPQVSDGLYSIPFVEAVGGLLTLAEEGTGRVLGTAALFHSQWGPVKTLDVNIPMILALSEVMSLHQAMEKETTAAAKAEITDTITTTISRNTINQDTLVKTTSSQVGFSLAFAETSHSS